MLRRFVKFVISLGLDLTDRMSRVISGRAATPSHGVVLYYHAVPQMQRQNFARQMKRLRRWAQPWALDAPVPRVPRWVGISFDDAYESVWENAVPELQRLAIPFTVFVPTGSLGRRPSWIHSDRHPFWQERVMTPERIRELATLPLVTLGSHTVSHPRLSQLLPAEAARELKDSKHALEDLTGRPVELFSFPHGDWTPQLVDLAQAAGYRRLFGIEPVRLEDAKLPPVVGRVAVEPGDTTLEFILKLKGCYRRAVHAHRASLATRRDCPV